MPRLAYVSVIPDMDAGLSCSTWVSACSKTRRSLNIMLCVQYRPFWTVKYSWNPSWNKYGMYGNINLGNILKLLYQVYKFLEAGVTLTINCEFLTNRAVQWPLQTLYPVLLRSKWLAGYLDERMGNNTGWTALQYAELRYSTNIVRAIKTRLGHSGVCDRWQRHTEFLISRERTRW